jgi:hypothetical protein
MGFVGKRLAHLGMASWDVLHNIFHIIYIIGFECHSWNTHSKSLCTNTLHSQKRHRLAASCGFYRPAASCQQIAAGLLTSSTCSKPVEIRLAAS